jgi:hypothetical protein
VELGLPLDSAAGLPARALESLANEHASAEAGAQGWRGGPPARCAAARARSGARSSRAHSTKTRPPPVTHHR